MPCHLAALPPSGSRCRAQNPFNWHSALVLTVSVTATRAIPPVPAPSGAPGHALATQATTLRSLGASGAALYRYAFLFANTLYPTLAEQEIAALREVWG